MECLTAQDVAQVLVESFALTDTFSLSVYVLSIFTALAFFSLGRWSN